MYKAQYFMTVNHNFMSISCDFVKVKASSEKQDISNQPINQQFFGHMLTCYNNYD